jgi:hypothetical protein
MVAAPARVAVKYDVDLQIIRITQSLNISPRELVFGKDETICERISENMSIIVRAAKAVDVAWVCFGKRSNASPKPFVLKGSRS